MDAAQMTYRNGRLVFATDSIVATKGTIKPARIPRTARTAVARVSAALPRSLLLSKSRLNEA